MQEKGILQGNLTKALLRMAVPLFVLNLVNSLYNIIDTFWVGQLGWRRFACRSYYVVCTKCCHGA